MKKFIFFLAALICTMVSFPGFSQKYKAAADTVKLNKEYVRVSNDIVELSAKLAIAQNNLPGYRAKAAKAVSDAGTTASESSQQAAKATNGEIADAKKAKKKAGAAFHDAQDVQAANNEVKKQEKKIVDLASDLAKKQYALKQLEGMRTAIRTM
jgi:CRISPR/Cas system-associated endonuclease Cas3-HD